MSRNGSDPPRALPPIATASRPCHERGPAPRSARAMSQTDLPRERVWGWQFLLTAGLPDVAGTATNFPAPADRPLFPPENQSGNVWHAAGYPKTLQTTPREPITSLMCVAPTNATWPTAMA